MVMIQIVNELSDINFQYQATSAVYPLGPERIQRLVCRSARPKAWLFWKMRRRYRIPGPERSEGQPLAKGARHYSAASRSVHQQADEPAGTVGSALTMIAVMSSSCFSDPQKARTAP